MEREKRRKGRKERGWKRARSRPHTPEKLQHADDKERSAREKEDRARETTERWPEEGRGVEARSGVYSSCFFLSFVDSALSSVAAAREQRAAPR